MGHPRSARRTGAADEVVKVLDIVMQPQEQKFWCWAAIATSVGLFFRTGSWSQCETASSCLDGLDCCEDPAPCNHFGFLEQALAYTRSLESCDEGTKTAAQIRAEIDLGHPVAVLFDWQEGGSHFALITGYSHPSSDPSRVTVKIEDSLYGPSTLLLTDFPEKYQHGGKAWTRSYLTRPQA